MFVLKRQFNVMSKIILVYNTMCPAARKTDVREEYYSAIKKNEIMPCAAT